MIKDVAFWDDRLSTTRYGHVLVAVPIVQSFHLL